MPQTEFLVVPVLVPAKNEQEEEESLEEKISRVFLYPQTLRAYSDPLEYEEEGRQLLKQLGIEDGYSHTENKVESKQSDYTLMGSSTAVKSWGAAALCSKESWGIYKDIVKMEAEYTIEELKKGKDGRFYMWFK